MIIALTLTATLSAVAAPARAADASDFVAGYLISDEDFFDKSAFTSSQITSFINAKNEGCLTGRVCLENYRETITAKSATSRCSAITAGTNLNAGQIIAKVSQACGISPKVILVMLQKEQSLVTARAPGSHAFEASMGAGCPDTAPCDGRYAGFYENVYYGASLLKGYTIPGSTHYNKYPAGATSLIGYNPKSFWSPPQCGKKSVYVRNQATHALYVYTPYTPNAAALANLYGTGDSCSAYGNRNFWRLWTDWFGTSISDGQIAIEGAYQKLGANNSSLGDPVGASVYLAERGSGVYQLYTNGLLAWNEVEGVHRVDWPFDNAWIAGGAAAGVGWPRTDTSWGDTGLYQNFSAGMLTKASGKSTYTLSAGLRDAYLAAGGPSGVLGWTTGARTTVRSGLFSQAFQGGVIFHDGTQHGYVDTRTLATFTANGGVDGILGWPRGGYVQSEVGEGGGYQGFAKGAIYVSTEHGAHTVYGGFSTGLARYGGLDVLGWPTADRARDEGTGILAQPFESGTMFTDGSKFALMTDEYLAKARTVGFITGALGWPTGTLTSTDSGSFHEFSGGVLTKAGDAEVLHVYGGLRTVFDQTGGVDGTLGWPITNRYSDTTVGTVNQDFEKGTVFFKGTRNGIVGTNFVALARTRGVATGALGWPTSGVGTTSAKGGGQYQSFAGGTLTWQSDNGAIYIPTTIWAAQRKAGGFNGPLGWPTGIATYNSKTATITQPFDGGVITWSKASGATVTLSS
jgi:uncharacterized protein with LGFP repeats